MQRKFLLYTLCLFLVFVFAGNIWAADESECPVMPAEAWVEWLKASEAAPKAEIDEDINFMLSESLDYGSSMDLSGHIDYDPYQRNQGGCGNCWVWAGTGVMEIAHDVDDGVFDRLSIQYLDSCKTDHFACCGGNLGAFATWYGGQGMAIPWDNTNASFDDAARGCADGTLVTCASIAKTPNYPIISISTVSIETHTGQAAAISNIKNILNQNKGVVFGFALPNSAAWGNFRSFWRCDSGESEATLWNDVDSYCGTEWDERPHQAGAHAVVIYGYNDDDADSANHYWLVLNSWGDAGGDRSNGFFRIPMVMDYDCSYPDDVNPPGYWAFSFETLDVEFGNALPIADANGPYSVECEGTTTTIDLDGSGSFDLEDPLSFLWSTDCPCGSFDDSTSATPVLTVSTSPGCLVGCGVTLTVTDGDGAADADTTTVMITDTTPPVLTCPADVTIECDESTDPSNTGSATATDNCDPSPYVAYSDAETPGACAAEKTITRTWDATDECGNTNICVQTINVVDTTPPVITCNAPATITPPDAPISFTATAVDNCDPAPSVSITAYDCRSFTKKGKEIDKKESCIVDVDGDTITIMDSGGVGTQITWTVSAVDECGNGSVVDCTVNIVKKVKP